MENPVFIPHEIEPIADYFFVIGLTISFCLHIPDGIYKVKVSEDKNSFVAQLKTQTRSKTTEWDRLTYQSKYKYFSVIQVWLPINGNIVNYDSAEKDAQKRRQVYIEQAITALNRLISIYRHFTGEASIKPLSGIDIWFDHYIGIIPIKETANVYATQNHSLIENTHPVPKLPREVIEKIHKNSFSNFQVPLSEELLLNSYEHLRQGNYRLAIIEAETGFETAIYSFLRDFYKSESAILYEIENIKSFGVLLDNPYFKKAIVSISRSFEKKDPHRIKWNEHSWAIRGNVVHGRIDYVSYSIALKAVTNVEETLAYLFERAYTNPWRFSNPS